MVNPGIVESDAVSATTVVIIEACKIKKKLLKKYLFSFYIFTEVKVIWKIFVIIIIFHLLPLVQ